MNQIRRKRPGSDKKGSSGRFLSRQSDGGGFPEDRETEEREEKQKGEGTGKVTWRYDITSDKLRKVTLNAETLLTASRV